MTRPGATEVPAPSAASEAPPVEVEGAGEVPEGLVELTVGEVAHGGHCVARHDNRVVFVRYALPGERVLARLERPGAGDRFWRAEAVEVLQASPHRVVPPCPNFGPGRCGGCDWQHADLAEQRRLKAVVVREQLQRLGRLPADHPLLVGLQVEAVPGDTDGLGWRTRMRFAVDAAGRLGLRPHRSHAVLPIPTCPIAHPELTATGVGAARWPGTDAVEVVVADPAGGVQRLVVAEPVPGAKTRSPSLADGTSLALRTAAGLQRVRGRTWVEERVVLDGVARPFRVTGAGFWQVHPGAAPALVEAVLAAAEPRVGESALDLYCGVGLFAAALAGRVGPGGSVLGVESDARACADARRNLHDLPQVQLVGGRVERELGQVEEVDVVVLDPPRAGAGRRVVEQILARRPRVVVYVACDPAALARDVAFAADLGYELTGLRALDLFPQTHHVECVAVLRPADISMSR